jgi:hypothetical protein
MSPTHNPLRVREAPYRSVGAASAPSAISSATAIQAATVVERGTGRTVGEVWSTLDDEQRRAYLLAAGVEVYVLSSAALRAAPGQEHRSIHGDPHKLIGTLQGITETDAAAG